jgi:5-keto 4-deoxyuronate isomerase
VVRWVEIMMKYSRKTLKVPGPNIKKGMQLTVATFLLGLNGENQTFHDFIKFSDLI